MSALRRRDCAHYEGHSDVDAESHVGRRGTRALQVEDLLNAEEACPGATRPVDSPPSCSHSGAP
jgi:hypothetical protein